MKLSKLLCILTLSVTLLACNGYKEISTKEQNTIENYINYEILYSKVSDKIDPPMAHGIYTYYKPKESQNKLIDMALKVENISDDEIDISDLKAIFTINGEDYSAVSIYNKSDNQLSQRGSIASQNTKLVHLYAEIDANTDLSKDITFTFIANEEKSVLTYKLDDLMPVKNYVEKGYILKENDIEIKIDKIMITDTINPTKPSSFYRYFKADKDKIFAALKATITNHSSKDITTSRLVGVKIFVGDKEYSGNTIVEDSHQANLLNASPISPNKTHTVYFITEIDKKEKNKDIEFCIYHGEEVYIKK